jgi:hypothetical protein
VALRPRREAGACRHADTEKTPGSQGSPGIFRLRAWGGGPLGLSYLRGLSCSARPAEPLTMSNCLSQLSLSLPRACLHVNAQRDRSRDKLRDKLSTGR